jgi:hypothetical protein
MPKPIKPTVAMRYLLIALLIPFSALCQEQELTGLWTGTLYNDITQKTLHYEVAISGSKGSYWGYSYTTFIIDTLVITGVKEVKIVRKDAKIFLDDEHWIVNKTKIEPPKGVRQISSLALSQHDSTLVLSGKFITTRTWKYKRSVTGTITLQKKADPKKSELVAILDSMGLTKNLTFLEPKVEPPVAVVKKEEKPAPPPPPPPPVVIEPKKDTVEITLKAPPPQQVAVNLPKKKGKELVAQKPQPITVVFVPKKEEPVVVKAPPPPPPPAPKKKEEPVVVKTQPPPPVIVPKKKDTIVVAPPPPKPVQLPPKPADNSDVLQGLSKRTIETIQTIYYDEDSLRLDVYDNGYVDGDIISIIVNGQVVVSHQMLTSTPISKMIHMKELGDSLNVIMYAENLGTIEPNTGMLSIYDGEKRYDVSFSGDLKKNASIILKRRKKDNP